MKPQVITQHVYPPIPLRQFDWCARLKDDDEADGPVAYGATEAEALKSLAEQLALLWLEAKDEA